MARRLGYFEGRSPLKMRPFALAAMLVPVFLSLAACKSSAQRAEEQAQQAQALAEAGNLVAARQSIDEAIALRDDQGRYHELRGAIAIRDNDPAAAYQSFTRALELDATNRLALAYVASIGVQVGQLNEADEAADRLLAIEPNALPALQVKGMIALTRERYDEATRIADRILAGRPGDEAAAIIKARALVKTGQTDEALQIIDRGLQTSQNSIGLLVNKLNFYRYLKQPEPMAPVLERVVALVSNQPAYRLDQTNLLYSLGRVDEARAAALALLTMGSNSPGDYAALQRIWWQYDKQPLTEAGARTVANWKDPRAIILVARYLLLRGDLRTVEVLLSSAPEKHEMLLDSLGARLLFLSGRTAEARKSVDAILKKDAQNADALILRAQFALSDGKTEAALEAAQLAVVNDPLNPEAYVALANIYRASGADARARQVFEDGMKNQPQNFYLVEQYADYLQQLGERGRAISLTRTFARAVPSLPRSWELFGTQCQKAGDKACLQSAAAGYQAARTAFVVDEAPGAAANRGLLGRL